MNTSELEPTFKHESRERSLSSSSKSTTRAHEDVEKNSSQRSQLTKKLVVVSYIVIIFTSLVERFSADSTSELASYATSSFNKHSMISTAQIVYKITAVCSYPVLGKIADLLGRAEGFALSISFYTICYVLFAACRNVETYLVGQIFFAIGRIGFKVYMLIFIADTTNLLNRGLWSQIPGALTGVPSTYAGSYIQDAFLAGPGWRWAYGAYAIILAVTGIPLIVCMVIVDRIAKRTEIRMNASIFHGVPEDWPAWKKICYVMYYKIDLIGFIIFLAGLILFFLPFSITGKSATQKWNDASTIVMIVIGAILLIVFVVWCEFITIKLPRFSNINPFIPLRYFNNKTILIAFLLVFLDYTENSIFNVYFSTTLQVGGYYSAGQAARINNSKKVTIDIASVITGVFMKYTKRSKIYVLMGIPLLVLGQGLLVWFMNRDGVMEKTILLYVMEIFVGIGRAFYMVSLQVMIQAYAGVGGIAMSTSFFLVFNSIGSLVGTAIAGGVWNQVTLDKLEKLLPEDQKSNAVKIFTNIKFAMSFAKGTPTRDAISLAYRETQQLLGWISLGIIVPMVFLMWFIKEVPLTEKHDVYGSDEGTIISSSEYEEGEKELESKKRSPQHSS